MGESSGSCFVSSCADVCFHLFRAVSPPVRTRRLLNYPKKRLQQFILTQDRFQRFCQEPTFTFFFHPTGPFITLKASTIKTGIPTGLPPVI